MSPEEALRLAKVTADLYADATTRLLHTIATTTAVGIDRPQWATERLAESVLLRTRSLALVNQLQAAATTDVVDMLRAAYHGGRLSPLSAPGMVAVNQRSVQALAEHTIGLLNQTSPRILRWTDDVYRSVIAEAGAPGVVTGTLSRRQATAAALDRFATAGVTGFTDRAGREWSLDTYAEMATRTAAGQAHLAGTLDRYAAQGTDLVIVSNSPEECGRCRPFEGHVLSISGAGGPPTLPDGITYQGSLSDARSAGLLHPNCTHRLNAYTPGLTRAQPVDTANPVGYEERQQQRGMERAIRESKRRVAVLEPLGDTPRLRQQRALLAARRDRLGSFVDAHDRKRLRYREQIGRPPGPHTPPPMVLVPEPAFVDRLVTELESGRITPATMRAQAAQASPLGKVNAEAALARHETSLAAAEAERVARGGPRTFASAQDARDWADTHWAGPDGYSPSELAVLRDYTGSAYGPMNNTLRTSKGKRTNPKIRTMDVAIERAARVPDDIVVVRNASLRQLGITSTHGDPRGLVGQTFVDHGYLSTSINRTGAMQGQVRLNINVPKGSRGVYVSGGGGPRSAKIISDYGGGESELIMDRGSKLVIRSVRKVGKRWHVIADLVQDRR